MSDHMPLWLDLFENDDIPEGDDNLSWCARAVDEIIADEELEAFWMREDDDPNYNPF